MSSDGCRKGTGIHLYRNLCPHALFLAALLCGNLRANAQEALAQARLEIERGRAANAIKILEDYHQHHPAVAEVYGLLGMAYASEGQADQAHVMFEEFARLAPNRPEAYNNLGASYLSLGDTVQAERAFRHALALRPNDPATLYNLGALLNARRDYVKARPLLVRALRRERTTGTIFELAVSQAGLGQRKEALRTLNSMPPPPGPEGVPWLRLLGTLNIDEGHLAEATGALEKVLALVPNDEVALYSLGLARMRTNHIAEAITLLEKGLASVPSAQRHLKVGALLAEHGADAEAITEFERAAAEDPKMYDAYFNLAVVRLRHKETDGAAEAAAHTLALRQSGEAYNLLGDIREAQGRYKEALENLQEAVRLEPDNEEFVFDLGLELILHGNYDAAHEFFDAAQAQHPRSARIALGLGAADFMSQQRYGDAMKAFLKAVNLDPEYEPAYTFLGMTYLSSRDAPAHIPAKLAQLAHSHPQSFSAQYYYGAALVKEMVRGGKPDKAGAALEALRQASALRPDYGPTYYYLGEIERMQDHIYQASRLYEKAVTLDPTFAAALYKLGHAYVKLGREEDALRILARHRELMVHEREVLDKRTEEIRTFVLKIRNER